MENQSNLSIDEIKKEYEILREKYELGFDLERMKQKQREELLYLKERKVEEERYRLLEMDISELLLKLQFENNQLKTNLAVLEKQQKEQESFPVKLGLTASSVLGIASLAFTIIPFFRGYFNIPQIVVSISIVVLFIAGVWIYKNWNTLSSLKNKKNIISHKIIEAGELHQYTSKVLATYTDKVLNLEILTPKEK